MWRIPATRMKGKREHRVPLSLAALAILEAMKPLAKGPDSYVFPGERRGKPLSNMALEMTLRRMNPKPEGEGERQQWCSEAGEAITVHGFRSAFRDWASEVTTFPREMAEMALAHRIDGKTEAAYRRMDMFEKRRRMMDAWAGYCGRPSAAKVVELRRAG
jgi:integrase